MKESTTSLPHILCWVPLTAGINILHNLTISVRDENGDYKLLQPSSLLFYFQKSFSRQNVRKKWVLYYPKAALALEEARRRSSTETIWWEKKTIYSTSARNVQREKNQNFFLPNFEMCHVSGVKMTCKVDMICPKYGLIKDMFSSLISHETNRKKQKDYYLLSRVKYFFSAKVLILIFYWLSRLFWFTTL